MSSREAVFITGFPGFIAGRLLRRLADKAEPERRFLLLVQPALAPRAREQTTEIAKALGKSSADFQILEGDITQPNLGLSSSDLELARAESTLLFHLAALYDLGVARVAALLVNVTGTRNVNEFAEALPHLRHYHYVSTCYIAGKRRGRILETELQHTASFRNYYEETKYLAEMEVEALKGTLPITIHRPSVVVGDSVSGETAKYDGIYYLIKYLLKWPRVLSVFNIGNSEVSLNLVPVDFVVESMTALAQESRAIGRTLQLADPNPLSTYQLFNVIAHELNEHGSRVGLPKPLVEVSLLFPGAEVITDLPRNAVPYFFLNQTYDTKQSVELLTPHGISCPPFTNYSQNIIDYVVRHPQPGG